MFITSIFISTIMANWDSKSVADTINAISENVLVLPVIQRRLVWDEDKMELLFDTLLKANSFGGIMTIQEDKDSRPLFAFRPFTKDGNPISSINRDKLEKSHSLIIDGQQRLQSFYIGLTGTINGKILYFDLFSDYKSMEFDFEFEGEEAKLPKLNPDRESAPNETKWVSVPSLFTRLKETNDDDQVAEEYIRNLSIVDDTQKDRVSKNIRTFCKNVFVGRHVGLAQVAVNRSLDEVANRQRIVDLFRRLNDGGTKLSAFDLMASILKGFDWRMEGMLDEFLRDYADLGVTQDVLIKLIFLLRDNSSKEMANIEVEDADFAASNSKRISATLRCLKKFLTSAKLYEYYKNENRSFIPLYFVVYHIFHKNIPTDQIESLFDTFETTDADFKNICKWMYLSLLNGIFKSKGAGWIPYKTGVRKILAVMKEFKGKRFPTPELFTMYYSHGVHFHNKIDGASLANLDQTFLFYLLYDRTYATRLQDIDHIQPQSRLYAAEYEYPLIHRIENYQLLDLGTNRGLKNGKPLKEWIYDCVSNKELYLSTHLIPKDETLWDIDKYEEFLTKRRELIIDKINSTIGMYN